MLIFQVAGIGDVDGDGVPDVAWGDVESVSKYDSATFFFDIPPTCAERQKSGECAKQPQSTIGFAGTYLGKKAEGYTPTLTDGSVYIGLLKADGSFGPCRDIDGERAPPSFVGDGFVLDGVRRGGLWDYDVGRKEVGEDMGCPWC